MNFVRRIVNSKVETNSNKPGVYEDTDSSLNQLKILFADYKTKISNSEISDHDQLLYDIIPLFHKIFCPTPGIELCERFQDVFTFCSHVSSLMVREIKKRATNQKTEEASLAIVQYLQPNLTQNSKNEENKGWVLLNVLIILSRGPAPLIECMITASLPSTFVKCLYIFFDLPNPEINCNQQQQHDSMFTLTSAGNKCCKYDPFTVHRRNILLDNFKQVLQRICFYPATTEELVRKEDLRLLFGAVASWCPSHNSGWRKAAADVLQTIAHNGLSQSTIQHIYHKKLISQCLKNVTKGGLKSIEIVDIFVTLFHLLRESSDVNQMLLDDFRNSQGYAIIEEFLIKLEKEISNETEQDSIRSLIILIAKLTTCGYVELRPKPNLSVDIIYPIEGFELPMPMNKNESIRNYYAFNVLQSVFLHAETDFLCLRILEAIKTIYQQDPANYFILEPQNTFQVFSEKLHKKSLSVQEELVNLIDCIVVTLNYVPVKEISSLSVIMKTCNVAVTTSLLVKAFIRLIEHNKIFKEVLKDMGILEISVNQLHSYAYNLKKEQDAGISDSVNNEQDELGLLLIDFLTLLISNCSKNIELFRKIGGSGCVLSLVNFVKSQTRALEFIKVLTLSSGSEEDMSNFLGLIRSINSQNFNLKIKVLESLFIVLKESHRCRIVFRKVHSFVVFIQELVHLEGCFSLIAKPPWDLIIKQELLEYVKCILSILTMALKKEPSNVRYFLLNVSYASLTEAIRNLGCFGSDVDLICHENSEGVNSQNWSSNQVFYMENLSADYSDENSVSLKDNFDAIFQNGNYQDLLDKCSETTQQTIIACCILKFMYDNAIEQFDNRLLLKKSKFLFRSDSKHYLKTIVSDSSFIPNPMKLPVPPSSINNCHSIIVHPEAVISLIHLIPAIRCDQNQFTHQIELQIYILERLNYLFSIDRNLQIMCESVSMPLELLNHFQFAMINENHPLHSLSLALFERLATQKVTPKNVRDFLRLADPLCCQPITINKDDINTMDLTSNCRYQPHNCAEFKLDKNGSGQDFCTYISQMQRPNGGPISLTRVKSLIGITTQQNQSDRVCVPIINDSTGETDYSEMRFAQIPSFVEMNMCYEGFGCLFLPSIAPQSVSSGISSVGLVSPIENNIIGGIGIGERVFPPTGGFSFSTWICVQKFSSIATTHPIRLLSLARSLQGSNEFISCLNISIINSPNHVILVSTKEEVFGNREQENYSESASSEFVAEFPCEMLLQEHCWIHLVLTFHRPGMIKHSSCSCFLNGQLIDTKKLNYISPNVSSSFGSMGTLITSVYAYIGTTPNNHKISNLCWRQGPVHFIEEPLTASVVSNITRLGPNYIGNFQNPILDYENPIGSLVAEEKVVFSLYANNISIFTLPRINKIYNELDGTVIARQLHLHPKEKSSPIRIIHNAAGHLSGAGRSLGAILIGYEGIRNFSPAPMTKIIDCVGGSKVLLGILAMANDAENLYAVVKLMCSFLIDNRSLLKELESHLGYKLISFLLKKKRHLLSSRIFSLLVGLTGSADQEFQDIKIEKGKQQIIHISSLNKSFNRNVFGEVICDLNLWLHCINIDNNNNQLLGNVLRHISEFFQKCVDSKYVSDSSERDIKTCRTTSILKYLLDLNLMERIIDLMMQFNINPLNTIINEPLSKLIELIISYSNKPDDLRRFGQFMVWTLSALGTSETKINLNENNKPGIHEFSAQPFSNDLKNNNNLESAEFKNTIYLIEIRNMCFKIILKILNNSINSETNEPKIAEELLKYLGFDWILLFMQPDVHPSTVVLAMRCLVTLLSVPQYILKFRDGILCSGWLTGTDLVLQKRHGLLLMDNARDQPAALREINLDSCHLPGFVYLQSLLPHHCRIPDIYFMLIALLLGNKIKNIPDNLKFEFESVCNFLFGNSTEQSQASNKQASGSGWTAGPIGVLLNRIDYQNNANKKSNVVKKSVEMCSEAATILLTMMRVMLNQNCNECDNENHTWIRDYPITLLRFFVYLYHSNAEFQSVAMQSDFLIGLTGAMYPSSDPGMKSSPKKINLFSPESIIFTENEKCGNVINNIRNTEMITLESLNSLPARKLIMDFFKMIIVDYFSLPKNSYQHVIDIILECDIENTTQEHMKQFQTVFMNSLTEHFMAVDILSGQNLPLPPGGSYANIPNNIYYFFSRVVDKVWQENYVDDPDVIISYLCRLISQGRKRQITQESLYRSFNRLILFRLSRRIAELKNKKLILKTLQKLLKKSETTDYGSGIFNPANSDGEFVVCLVHLLIQLINGINIVGYSTWYNPDSISTDNIKDNENQMKYLKLNEQIRSNAESLWQEISTNKKQLLEEAFKIQLSSNLLSISPNIEQICLKTWNSYIESENIGTASSHWGRISLNIPLSGGRDSSINTGSNVSQSLQHQISIKLNRMSRNSVLGRLSSSTSITTASGSGSFSSSIGASRLLNHVSLEEARLWIPPHISVVKELMDYHKNVFLKKESFMMHYLESKWKSVESELNRERGLWGPMVGSCLDKWMLDSAEGPCRMRKKMIPNEYFYQHYPYRPYHRSPCDNNENHCQVYQIKKFKVAASADGELYYCFSMSKSILKTDEYQQLSPALDMNDSNNPKTVEENINCSNEDPEESLRNTESLLRGRKVSVSILDTSIPMKGDNKIDDEWQDTKFKPEDIIDQEDEETFNKDNMFSDTVDDSDFPLDTEKTSRSESKLKKLNSEQSLDSSAIIPNPSAQSQESAKKQSSISTQWDNQVAIEHMIGSDEKIHFMFRCARIQGLDVHEGLLLFGQSYFYIIDGFTLLKTREIVEINNIPIDVHEPIVPSTPTVNTFNHRRKMSDKFSFGEIREVHKRRYLLQPIAVEVFLGDGRNFLLAFPKKMQNKIYAKFIQVASSLTLNAQHSISGQKQNSKIEAGSTSIFSNFMGEKSVTQRWEKGEISNFQYLMYLNTLAGRSYNDLMQYPVFPWILADYESETLDLTSPSTFRQLDKPMGAQSENRLHQFEKRYREWDDPSGETPPYHYGTHYSSAMIVAFYLVRMEPFTQHFLKLQGGHFDLADRMFHSIKDTWESASQHNMADIKELIPEFFYLPNFLNNTNKFDLGNKQNGVVLGDILLPPWAKGDSREFIRAHREALECDYVSAHLNEWIDLIFGYKQLGDAAVEAVNVFHHLFYEGNVDIYSIDDPLKRSAVIGFINNFGQIPKQLFKKPHPTKRLLIPISIINKQIDPMAPLASSAPAERLFYHNLDNMEPSLQPVKELKNAVGQIIQADLNGTNSNAVGSVPSSVLAVEQNKCLIPPLYTRYVAWGFSDGSLRVGNYDSDKLIKVYEMPDPYGDIMCVLCLNERILITGGFSTVVRVWNMSVNASKPTASGSAGSRLTGGLAPALSLQANLYGHIEAVTCLAVAASYNLLVSGSRDRTCIMWDLGRMCYLRQLSGHAAPVAAICISEVTGMVASCAGTYLHLWSIDGEELASVNTATGRSKQILTVTMSTMMDWDPGNVVITGGTDGVVRMWSLEYVQVPISTSFCSADFSEPQAVSSQPGFESVSSVCESSNLEEDEYDQEEIWQSSKSIENKSQTATLTRSNMAISIDNKDKSSDELDEEYVVIGSNEINSDLVNKSVLSEDGINIVERANNSKVQSTLLKSLSQPQMRPNMRKLRKGFHWQRQLIFRSKLTMHTAYERSDNANPSPISSLAISRDHRSIYVGDQRGRVFFWSVPQEPGRSMADHWIRDENAEVCIGCKIRFSLTERRHHCRNCGLVFCNKCSKHETEIHRLRLFKPVRVCAKCFYSITSQQSS